MTGGLAFPAEPVQRLLLARFGGDLQAAAAVTRVPRRTLQRILGSSRLSWQLADRLAVALGRHPAELWPDWFVDG